MKNMDPHADSLDDLLMTWQVNPPASTSFPSRVWTEIAARSDRRGPWRSLPERWSQPRFALLCLLSAILIGGGAGAWQATQTRAVSEQKMAARYIDAIDPYTHHLWAGQ